MTDETLSSWNAMSLARLRDLRAKRAETQAHAAFRVRAAAEAARAHGLAELDQHRALWRDAETRHRNGLANTANSHDLRDARARLDDMADRACALQKTLDRETTALDTARREAEAALLHAARLRRAGDQADTMVRDARAREEAARTAQDDDEQDELMQMRATRRTA